MKKVLIAAGGTGGHIYPGLAIADQLKQMVDDIEIIFVGSYVGMEKNIIPKYGYPMAFIRARGFEKGFSLETLEAVKGIFDSIKDSKALLKKEKPDLVIGTGGFTCGMLLKEAAKKGIPTMIHEQNAFPGRSNRMLGKAVDRIAISFDEARQYFPKEKTIFTGNPVRDVFKTINRQWARKQLNLKPNQKLILAVGGSQGAGSINQAMVEMIANNQADDRVFYHLTGKGQYDDVIEALKKLNVDIDAPNLTVEPFSTDMHMLLGASDLVISRSGAMSIAELAVIGVPSILIPYPLAAGDHQTVNAQAIVDLGGGVMIHDDILNGDVLVEQVDKLLSQPEKLKTMGMAARDYGRVDADVQIAKEALALMS